jgi:phage shock protein PspC (stress-responsive transcriptional regulator)
MELTTETTPTEVVPPPLHRPLEGRMVAGVAAGAAEYLDIDVVIVRIVFVALALVGGLGIPLYLAAWLLVPEEGANETIADGVLDHLRTR